MSEAYAKQFGKTVELQNRDIQAAFKALNTLATNRGFASHKVSLKVGKTIRQLRQAGDLITDAHNTLVLSHQREDVKPNMVGLDRMKDGALFLKESNALQTEKQKVMVWPVRLSQLGLDEKKCEKCSQVTGLPDSEGLAVLVEAEILVEDPEEE